MSKHSLTVGLAIALTGLSLPAAAMATPGSPAAQAKSLGQCLVKASRANAISVFGRLPADNTIVDPSMVQSGGDASCTVGASGISAMQLRGALAEALYARDFREAGVAPRQAIGNFAQLDLPEGALDPGGIFAVSKCVARVRFADVDKLFAMPPESRREADFIETLMPYFAACQPSGTRISIRRGDIRPLIAQSAYVGNVTYWRRQAMVR